MTRGVQGVLACVSLGWILCIVSVWADKPLLLSADIANMLCHQVDVYKQTSQIQPPMKTRPPKIKPVNGICTWFSRGKHCGENNNSVCVKTISRPCSANSNAHPNAKASVKANANPQKLTPESVLKTVDNANNDENMVEFDGKPIKVFEFPSAVSLIDSHTNMTSDCSGVIINQNWILTAQQCVGLNISFAVVAGSAVRSNGRLQAGGPKSQYRLVTQMISHPRDRDYMVMEAGSPSYIKSSVDLALLKLGSPLEFNEFVQPAVLSETVIAEKGPIIIVGIENIITDDPIPSQVFQLEMHGLPMESCEEKVKAATGKATIFSPHSICLSPKGTVNGACFADPGGPAYQIQSGDEETGSSQEKSVLVGIGSLLSESTCDKPGSVVVYTQINFFIDWIQETAV